MPFEAIPNPSKSIAYNTWILPKHTLRLLKELNIEQALQQGLVAPKECGDWRLRKCLPSQLDY